MALLQTVPFIFIKKYTNFSNSFETYRKPTLKHQLICIESELSFKD